MRTIEIDIDIHKAIEAGRSSFDEEPRHILRKLLKIDPVEPLGLESSITFSSRPVWHSDGVTLEDGTELRMVYNGREYRGAVKSGAWEVENRVFHSPSGAASSVARTKSGAPVNLDGWKYWEALAPGSRQWVRLATLRLSPTQGGHTPK